MLELVHLAAQGDRYPHELSGGQQQRVALAQALAIEPQVLLLDEPLSALDAKVRAQLRDEIRRIQTEVGITTLFVTHDQDEALAIADRVAVMFAGRLGADRAAGRALRAAVHGAGRRVCGAVQPLARRGRTAARRWCWTRVSPSGGFDDGRAGDGPRQARGDRAHRGCRGPGPRGCGELPRLDRARAGAPRRWHRWSSPRCRAPRSRASITTTPCRAEADARARHQGLSRTGSALCRLSRPARSPPRK